MLIKLFYAFRQFTAYIKSVKSVSKKTEIPSVFKLAQRRKDAKKNTKVLGKGIKWTSYQWLPKTILISIVVLMIGYIYGLKIEPNWFQVVRLQLNLPHLTQAFDGFKIVQISDIHVSHYMTEKRLERVVNLVNQQKPDIVVITGDFINKYRQFVPPLLVKELKKLNPQELTLSVLGNHDHWRKRQTERLRKALVRSDVINLDNQVYTLTRGREKLIFAGIDDPYTGQGNLAKLLEVLPEDGAVILLVHEPDFADISQKIGRFDLQLSGHSHGGQIRLPLLGALVLPSGGKKYVMGLQKVNNMIEYTNRGVGMTKVPFRFGSRPEITVFTLKTASKS
jgi:hypothetical protein